ncbi:diguanylate cyclase domain-containing protein [Pseudoalteromonas tunicata]|uniref:GGDEF domain-containing protein n=1 Tax=Pseudoalteromonas tunicata D2 TaxID=87626 RepID=A4C4J3_9GAMM|nr:diguanylate cyclase [Pseudoalteromonas tunicata]ATC97043.1 hypothetical protein PTUN_b0699 [Pseudoalteromonas tunicata]AXT33162.1 diguanylate cyclase [Pseudoalteromonas tunicata]EAR30475.1 hypothetical protein PTD2_02861 [Pseudoalteromonas tunicata D2]
MIDLLKTKVKKRSKTDFIVLTGSFLVIFLLCSRLDVLEVIHNFSRAHETYEVDEIFTALILMTAIFGLFAYRRWQDVKILSLFCEELSMLDPFTQLPNQRALERLLLQLKQGQSYPCSFLLVDINGLENIKNTLGLDVSEQVTIELLYQISLKLGTDQLLINRNTSQYMIFCPEGTAQSNAFLIEQIKNIELSSRFNSLQAVKIECVAIVLLHFVELQTIFEALDEKLLQL